MKALIMAVLLFVPLSVAAHSPVEFLDIIDETKKSVVHVINTVDPDKVQELPSIAPPGPNQDPPPNKERPSMGTGTGFIIEGGYIITNHHVIADNIKIEVYFENSPRPYEVTVVGSDESVDIAVLKVGDDFPKDVPALKWRTEPLRTGAEVWVLGHPQGLTYSVSKGIVSHLDRRIVSPWQPTIQTDAAINQGNSGGPLLDMHGELVGVNVMILSRVAEFNGLGLAIEGNTARRAIARLVSDGVIERPLMGVALGYDDDTFQVAAKEVSPDGAAAVAGMKQGDIYLEVDGLTVDTINDVFDILALHYPEDIIKVKVERNGSTLTIDVKLGRKTTQ